MKKKYFGTDGIRGTVNIGNINVTPRFYGAVGIDRIPPIVDHYLMGIRIGGRANLSIKRS